MLATLPSIEKITLSTLWLAKVKGHGHPNLTVSRSCYKFLKIFKPRHGFISWYFLLIFGRIVADKIIFYLMKFYCKISNGLWDILGQTWPKMKKLEKWFTSVTSVTHHRSENLRWKFFTKRNSWMILNVFVEKKSGKVCAKTTNFVSYRCLNTLAPGWFRWFSEKKRLNARGFAREFLRSGMLYRPGGQSSTLHTKKNFFLGGCVFCEWRHKWRTFRPPWLTLPGPGRQLLGGSFSLKFLLQIRPQSKSLIFWMTCWGFWFKSCDVS